MMISLWAAAGWNKGLLVCFREPSWWGRMRLFQVNLWHASLEAQLSSARLSGIKSRSEPKIHSLPLGNYSFATHTCGRTLFS